MTKKTVATLASSAQWIARERRLQQALCELRQWISELRRLSASLAPTGHARRSMPSGTKGKSKQIRATLPEVYRES